MSNDNLIRSASELFLFAMMALVAAYIHQHEPLVAYWRQFIAILLPALLVQAVYLMVIRPARGLPPLVKTRGKFRF